MSDGRDTCKYQGKEREGHPTGERAVASRGAGMERVKAGGDDVDATTEIHTYVNLTGK